MMGRPVLKEANPFRSGRHRSTTTEVVDLPKRHTFSFEVGLNEDAKRLDLSQYSTVTGALLGPRCLRENLNFGTAFEFAGDDASKQKKGPANGSQARDEYKSIFTYANSAADPFFESAVDDFYMKPSTSSGLLQRSLLLLSFVFLVLFLPIIGWIFIRRLSRHERLVIFRLGKRLKPRGPGVVIILPFVDEYHLVNLNEQQMNIKPVSGATLDRAFVELGCCLTYCIIDAESVFSKTVKGPESILHAKAQSALVASLSSIRWEDLNCGHATMDVVGEVRAILNSFCGSYGIQVTLVTLGEVKTVRPPSPTESTSGGRLDLRKVLQQLANCSPILLPVAGLGKGPEQLSPPPTALTLSPEREEAGKLLATVLSRAQTFLNSEAVCATLGRKSLQIHITGSEASDTLASAYLDATTGVAAMGELGEEKKPSATLWIGARTLSTALAGGLDLVDSVRRSEIRLSADLVALSKLRYLIQLQPSGRITPSSSH